MCAVTRAELIYGALKMQQSCKDVGAAARFFAPLGPCHIDDAAAEHYARIRAKLKLLAHLVGPNDLLIAAIRLAHGLIVVTHNTREFSRVDGLHIEDWEAVEVIQGMPCDVQACVHSTAG